MMQFFLRVLRVLVQPSAEWIVIKDETKTPAELFKGYALPLALIPFFVALPIVLSHEFYLTPVFGIIINLLIFSATLFMMHIVSVVVATFSTQLKAPCDQMTAMKLAYYSATPAIVLLALFPLLQGFSLLGFLWSFVLFIMGSKKLLSIPERSFFRFVGATLLLTFAAFCMLNLFIVGMINIIVGPQPG